MAIERNSPIKRDEAEPEIDTHGIVNLRYYKHYKGGTYFTNGFAIHEKTLKTVVLYTDGFTGRLWARLAEDFISEVEPGVRRFTLMEKK